MSLSLPLVAEGVPLSLSLEVEGSLSLSHPLRLKVSLSLTLPLTYRVHAFACHVFLMFSVGDLCLLHNMVIHEWKGVFGIKVHVYNYLSTYISISKIQKDCRKGAF